MDNLILDRMLTYAESVRVADALRKARFNLDFAIGSKTGSEVAWLIAGNYKARKLARTVILAALRDTQ